ncbi:MAG TPA: DUF1800 domain-containing protein [Gemmatimonas sp.]|nr:DUF1800 domain-containing protein [Gemmatimonas sp.]
MRTHDEAIVIDEETPPAGAERPSRRRFLTMGAAAGAAAAAAATGATALGAQLPPRGPKVLPVTPPGSGADVALQWKDPVVRLVRRITMGATAEEVAFARQLGYVGYLNYQLNPAGIEDSAVETEVAARMPLTTMTPTQLATQDANEATAQLQDAALHRAAFSKQQLKERMVEFWTDHFTISLNRVGILKIADDRDVVRRHAMTTFPQLLRATSESAAMLVYLDQNQSRTPTPNQNYAREIMELHTLGVDGGYTQTDVAELSRILTGWSTGAGSIFQFNRNSHDRNAKTFLGRAFPAMPSTATTAEMKAEGDSAIQMLVEHPSTAQYLSLKMARWLLAYAPPQSVVDATAAVYRATGGSIPAMIRTILSATNLMASPAKYKRPFHFAVSAIRGMGAQVTSIRGLRQSADRMGMPMYLWEQPNGYPDRVDWWSGLVLNRWGFTNTIASLASATTVNVSLTPFRTVNTPEGVVSDINTRMFAGEMPQTLRAQLLVYLRGGTFNDARIRETMALAASANEFQWY